MTVITTTGLMGMMLCAYTDFKKGRIYNQIIIPLIIVSLIMIAIMQRESLMESIKYGAIAWGIFLIPVVVGLIGGGDGKLVALTGILFKEGFVIIVLYFLMVVMVWFIIYDVYRTKSLKTTILNLLLFKKYSTHNHRHKWGGPFIMIATLIYIYNFII